uniref:eukaryotic translation initiation factor 4B-like isoform X2 n=1 Tax=Callithrix jacchus TaxID=9483 RepID=UPI00159D1026|nr:eukaryotic translation initiation factor 4B-like isoform X2 [Callithrix jacchus]
MWGPVEEAPMFPNQSAGLKKQMTWKEMLQQLGTVLLTMCIGRLQLTDHSVLPTAPPAARELSINRSRLPKSPPDTAFLGNLTYDVTEESIKEFFRGLNISAVCLPREPSNPERLKGFGYAEFENLDSVFSARSLSGESLGNQRIPVDMADKAQNKGGVDRSFGHDRSRDSDKTDTDWRELILPQTALMTTCLDEELERSFT